MPDQEEERRLDERRHLGRVVGVACGEVIRTAPPAAVGVGYRAGLQHLRPGRSGRRWGR